MTDSELQHEFVQLHKHLNRDAAERGFDQREQTAATILAALTRDRMVPGAEAKQPLDVLDHNNVRYAVMLTDSLRAELAKGTP